MAAVGRLKKGAKSDEKELNQVDGSARTLYQQLRASHDTNNSNIVRHISLEIEYLLVVQEQLVGGDDESRATNNWL